MNTMRRLSALGLMLCALAACNRDDLQLPKAVEGSAEEPAIRDPATPFVVSATAGKVGAAIDGNGDISEARTTFAPDEKVYVSMNAKGRRQGDRVHVYWFHSDGLSRKEEEKKIAGPFVAFDFSPSETGRYSIEIDVNDRPIGLVDFEVK